MTSATHETTIHERLIEAFRAHMQRTHEVWTAGGKEAEERFAASMLELVDVWEAALSTTLTAARIEQAADFFWVYFTEFACRADVAPEGPARPPSEGESPLDVVALGDVVLVVGAVERLRGGPLVANELVQCASICGAAASALHTVAMQRRRQEQPPPRRPGRLDS